MAHVVRVVCVARVSSCLGRVWVVLLVSGSFLVVSGRIWVVSLVSHETRLVYVFRHDQNLIHGTTAESTNTTITINCH